MEDSFSERLCQFTPQLYPLTSKSQEQIAHSTKPPIRPSHRLVTTVYMRAFSLLCPMIYVRWAQAQKSYLGGDGSGGLGERFT